LLEDAATRRAEHLVAGPTMGIMVHERMDDADDRETRAGRVTDRGLATIGVPAEDLIGEHQAAHGVRACGQFHAAGGHLEDVCSACCIEHVRTARKRANARQSPQ